MPELDQQTIQKIASQEIIPKTIAFCPALTVGEIDDIPRLSAIATAVALMYWGDQTMDRGDEAVAQAIELLATPQPPTDPVVRARRGALTHIKALIDQLALPDDAPYVLACFYDQVLKHEVTLHRLSQEYLAAPDRQRFLADHASLIAETTTISAGFPSIASSLYAIYRQHDTALPPLAHIYSSTAMTNLLQVCNVVVRLWDELGDWQMDSGHDPRKGLFVINPLNEYHPAIVRRFCELAFIDDARQIRTLQEACANFHTDHQKYTPVILATLREHIRQYLLALDSRLSAPFGQYVTLCKRVMEIGYVNRIGDIALTSPDSDQPT